MSYTINIAELRRLMVFLIIMTAMIMLGSPSMAADAPTEAQIDGANLQKVADGVLTLMGFSLTPDVTTGSLSFSDAATGNPGFTMTSLGGGFTLSKNFPLYLEGTAAYSRYDPTFLATDGTDARPIPVKWNSLSATGGIGWDFTIAQDLVLRPIVNFSLGQVKSDLLVGQSILSYYTGRDIDFLDRGYLNALGLGGSLMLDYELVRPEHEIDLELRYTNIYMQGYGNSSSAVKGTADSQNLSLYSRWRAPTGLILLQRPFRYVLEFTHTQFLGDLRGALGFNSLTSLGAGCELDSTAYKVIITRTRLMARYKFGEGVTGWSVGLACSF